MVIRAGNLDTKITIQRKADSFSNTGEPVEVWSNVSERWANVRPISGSELNAAEQWIAREQVEFTVRWSADINEVSPLDRVVCPANDASVSPEVARSIYDIIAVRETSRHNELRILAARRVA